MISENGTNLRRKIGAFEGLEEIYQLIEKKIDLLYCSDSLDVRTVLTLIFRVKSNKIFFHALEMYSISFKALVSEIKFLR